MLLKIVVQKKKGFLVVPGFATLAWLTHSLKISTSTSSLSDVHNHCRGVQAGGSSAF
jgi:hypothetical protein